MRFTEITLTNWRNFQDVGPVPLQRRAFLVGANAVGKSNLLDAFRFLQEIASPQAGLQQAIAKRRGVSPIRCLAARGNPDIGIAVGLGDSVEQPEWRYSLVFGHDKQQRPQVKREEVIHLGTPLLERPSPEDKQDPERLTQTHLEQVSANKDFREVAEFLASVRYLHLVPQLVREPDRSVGRAGDPYGGDFLETVAATPDKTQQRRLDRIAEALRVAVPQLTKLELRRDERGTPHLRGSYKHWRGFDAYQLEDQFSDGTLRLLGLLWSVLDGKGPLLLEEPELSLHSEVVRTIPQVLSRLTRSSHRQLLVSTHSRDVLEDTGLAADEVLVLAPGDNGSTVTPVNSLTEARRMLDAGLTMADAVLPITAPERAEQLMLSLEV